MLTILHGDNITASRNALLQCIEVAVARHIQIVRLDAKGLTAVSLTDQLGTQSLFDQQRLVVIEGLYSLPRGSRKDLMIKILAGTTSDVVLWDKKALTVTQLKQFPTAKIQTYKTGPLVFKFTDSLRPQNAQQMMTLLIEAERADGIEMCFAMFMRQVRLLLQVKTNSPIAGAPFMIAKVRKQAESFSLEQLLALHEKLLEIDELQKTSGSPMTLRQQLDLVLISI